MNYATIRYLVYIRLLIAIMQIYQIKTKKELICGCYDNQSQNQKKTNHK